MSRDDLLSYEVDQKSPKRPCGMPKLESLTFQESQQRRFQKLAGKELEEHLDEQQNEEDYIFNLTHLQLPESARSSDQGIPNNAFRFE